ncbi:hypothetical protein C5B42_05655 [Candidatus Cerribacteria bacterium 'Amazon FNV 2010 28 9']|uniref:Uncharacterized protein n=1 Tax=Candidatus Cerribacteria bacterium 'Amazon FNV 2010 28 9' TaxID=2081795 RepID=A0A317JN24_9BACT|nr:MAG: hypothetical protein C5B42_05655 [Candidatus Cerribacteria bacterium 'Amazon FNV 2010 28 9']
MLIKQFHLVQILPYFFAGLPFFVTGLASFPWYTQISTPLFIILLVISLVGAFVVTAQKEQYMLLNRIYFAIVLTMLLVLVQNTGWFYSPLLFILYLATIALCLLYSYICGSLFLASIAVLCISYIGRATPVYDFIRIAAFFTAIPLAVVFSREFLRLKENEKQILILKDEREQYKNELERLHSNKLIWNDVMLRQSLATARNFAYYWDSNGAGLPTKLQRDLKRLAKKLDESLVTIKEFEKKSVDETYL